MVNLSYPFRRRGLLAVMLAGVTAACLLLSGCGRAQVDEAGGASRAIQNKGSDTIVNLALAWAEAYQKVDPSVSIAVTGGGSGTGLAALVNNTVDIANASRKIKDDEIAAAQANGVNPVEFVIAVDALAVIVNPANPVSELTIVQLSDIFTGRITNWRDVGGNDTPIILVSRESNSGTHVYFLEEVIRGGDPDNKDIFAAQTLMMPSSVGITSEISRNPNAIGYDGLGYITKHEKMIAVAKDSDSPYVIPSVETGADGSYPLARNLYMYTNGEPSGVIAEYLDWIRGPDGQKIVTELGFVPIAQK
jgi:phosphate transport system substrate-binding protein